MEGAFSKINCNFTKLASFPTEIEKNSVVLLIEGSYILLKDRRTAGNFIEQLRDITDNEMDIKQIIPVDHKQNLVFWVPATGNVIPPVHNIMKNLRLCFRSKVIMVKSENIEFTMVDVGVKSLEEMTAKYEQLYEFMVNNEVPELEHVDLLPVNTVAGITFTTPSVKDAIYAGHPWRFMRGGAYTRK